MQLIPEYKGFEVTTNPWSYYLTYQMIDQSAVASEVCPTVEALAILTHQEGEGIPNLCSILT
jgi:hypothetical protein